MNKKKLILSTILSTSIFYSLSAEAVITVEYTANGAYRIEGVNYATLAAAGQAMLPRILADEPIQIDQASQPRYLQALFDNATVRGELVTAINAFGDEDTDEISLEEANQFIGLVQAAANKLELTTEDIIEHFVDLNDLFDADIEELEDAAEYLTLLVQGADRDEKLAELYNQLLSANSALQEASNKYTQVARSNTASAAEKKAAADEFYSKPELKDVRQSAAVQDDLKELVSLVELGSKSENSKLQATAKAQLETLQETISLYAPQNVKKASELSPVQSPETKSTESIFTATKSIYDVIGGRINAVGVAAGDMFTSYGVWVKGIFSAGEQKTDGLSDGYKFSLKGATIGVDTGDEHMFGIAYSFITNDVKSKLNSSTKDEIPLHMGTVYGMATLSNEIFLNAQVHYGQGDIKKKRATGDSQRNIMSGKTKAKTVAGSLGVSYDYAIDSSHLIPTIGISHNKVDVNGYTEKGNGLKRTVGKRSFNRTSGLAGIMYKHNMESGGNIISPEVHANVDYAFSTKNDSTKVTLVSGLAPIIVPAEKQLKGIYTLGGSVKFEGSAIEASVGYDFGLSKKYQSHTGTVKLRVNL